MPAQFPIALIHLHHQTDMLYMLEMLTKMGDPILLKHQTIMLMEVSMVLL